MDITILTLFPSMFSGPFDASIVKRAIAKKAVTITFVDIRDFATDKHKSVDEHPYGGGTGMILRVDVVARALAYAKSLHPKKHTYVVSMDPQGKQLKQTDVKRLSAIEHLILLCGHYEGVDERIRSLVDEELSIGDYILTCGELPAMVLVDAITRLLPGVLKKEGVTANESFEHNLLEYPQYTKPEVFNGQSVPKILLSGNHAKISLWQQQEAHTRTQKTRPDLLSTEQTDQP